MTNTAQTSLTRNTSIHIIPLAPAHKDPIRKLLWETDAFRSDEIDVAIELIDDTLSKNGKLLPDDYHIHVAVENTSDVLGYVCFGKTPMTLSTFDLYWIAVYPKAQGKGVGKKLFDFTCERVGAMGGKLIVIETASQPKYDATRRFYDKIGCTLEARIKNFYSVGDDKLIYTKHL
jgi:ribosomal protein S18 acetylase RimI-like enzyme